MKRYIKSATTIQITEIENELVTFHFKGTDSNGWKRDVHQIYVKYPGSGQFVELILVDDNSVKIAKARKKFKFADGDLILTDSDKNDVTIGHYEVI